MNTQPEKAPDEVLEAREEILAPNNDLATLLGDIAAASPGPPGAPGPQGAAGPSVRSQSIIKEKIHAVLRLKLIESNVNPAFSSVIFETF